MNCKPGDLAVFVRSYAGNEGKIVRVISLLPDPWAHGYGSENVWITDQPTADTWGANSCTAMDELLRPIRDPGDDARDETLNWLPVPTKEIA